MKRKLAIMTSVGVAAGLVSGCGGGNQGQSAGGGSGGSTAPTSVSLTTVDVLSLAQKQSETAAPFALDSGAVMLTDTSETSEPININAM
jgi:hypothetical protein